jgi:hypothetical protein
MRFLVEVHFRETVILDGMVLDDTDFVVDAPSERIAEYKVRNCYPLALTCNFKLLGPSPGESKLDFWQLIHNPMGELFPNTRAENAEREQTYIWREAYKAGWEDCEQKKTPQFIEWVEQDSKDIHPYRGPAKSIGRGV